MTWRRDDTTEPMIEGALSSVKDANNLLISYFLPESSEEASPCLASS